MNKPDELQAMIEILKQHDMKIAVGGCGCCGSAWVSFEYQGRLIVDDSTETNVDMFKEEKPNG